MAVNPVSPNALRRKASTRLIASAAVIALAAIAAFSMPLEVFAMVGVGAACLAYWLLESEWHLRRKARVLRAIQAETLVSWSFSPAKWKVRMKQEAEAPHAPRPRWIVPIVAAVLGAAAVPFLAEGSGPQHTSVLIAAVLGFLAFGIIAHRSKARRTQRLRAASNRVIIASCGALVGEQLVDWGVYGQLVSIELDESRHALVARHRVRFREGKLRFDLETLLPVPEGERAKALELVLRLAPLHS